MRVVHHVWRLDTIIIVGPSAYVQRTLNHNYRDLDTLVPQDEAQLAVVFACSDRQKGSGETVDPLCPPKSLHILCRICFGE